MSAVMFGKERVQQLEEEAKVTNGPNECSGRDWEIRKQGATALRLRNGMAHAI
jgi:hypothetical protein